MKVQVIKGEIKAFGLPETFTHEDGSTTSGYPLLSEDVHKKDGWVDLIEDPPSYEPSTHHLEYNGYLIEDKKVITLYNIVENTLVELKPTEDERIKKLEKENAQLFDTILWMMTN